ncbi:alanine aminotransferase 1 [Toxorhynchites rutilus septentrionalis]|uniref:alanine aminotransferase 1 n=1 Tax=Toxorhynchites rutilus septentrionalis TaxID=329112 RepID=UPI00247A2082|nr:alanine aminotransferase 1 [Toxorhynchites rutilus septentrionalis]
MSLSRVLNVCPKSGFAGGLASAITTSRTNASLGRISTLLPSVVDQQQQQQRRVIHTNHWKNRKAVATRTMSSAAACVHEPCISLENINPAIKVMEYAVRGPLVIRAAAIEKELEQGVKKPFKEVIRANIGDCHAMGQQPITFLRQVLGLVAYPPLFNDKSIPEDAKEHARIILDGCKGRSVGSYTDSNGIEVVRRHVAEYIQNRDGGIPSDPNNIILSAGASGGIKVLMSLLRCPIDGKTPGVMIPIPQYPLYSATIAEFEMEQVGYYLDEANKWGLDIAELQRSLNEARKTCAPRILVVINPGNPTGQVLSKENIQEIIKFACNEKLVLFADEVYQDNIYAQGSKFHSFKKVLMEMGAPYNQMELCSFMSCSKGYMGECGIRGGYAEVINMCPNVKAMLLKCISAQLCPTTIGQACMDVVVNPPKQGEPSYELFIKEKNAVLASLKERAEMVANTFNSIEGFTCNPVQGAMYAFPQIRLPQKAIEAAKKAGQAPDVFYAFQLLEQSGICIVPGSGFGQRPGTFHFRTTILPQPAKLKEMLGLFKAFHEKFVQQYK